MDFIEFYMNNKKPIFFFTLFLFHYTVKMLLRQSSVTIHIQKIFFHFSYTSFISTQPLIYIGRNAGRNKMPSFVRPGTFIDEFFFLPGNKIE